MKRIIAAVFVTLFALAIAGFAAVTATKADAEDMVRKGAAFVKAHGKKKALAEFSALQGSFVKGELYVYVVDSKGIILAHGTNAKLIGKNMWDLKDASGKSFMQEIVKVGKQGSGWVEYQWTNPVSKKIKHKIAYVQAVDDMILICGIYKL